MHSDCGADVDAVGGFVTIPSVSKLIKDVLAGEVNDDVGGQRKMLCILATIGGVRDAVNGMW